MKSKYALNPNAYSNIYNLAPHASEIDRFTLYAESDCIIDPLTKKSLMKSKMRRSSFDEKSNRLRGL